MERTTLSVSARSRVPSRPNVNVGIGIILKSNILVVILAVLWMGYALILSFINSASLRYSTVFNAIDQPDIIVPTNGHTRYFVFSQPHNPEIGIFVNVALLALLSLYVAYNQMRGFAGHEAVLKRPILDLYDHISWMTIPISFTYYVAFEFGSPSILPVSLFVIQAGNILMALLYRLAGELEPERKVIYFFINVCTFAPFSAMDPEKEAINGVYTVLVTIFWSYEIFKGPFIRRESGPSKGNTTNRGIFSEHVYFICQIASSIFLVITSILSFYWMLKLYDAQCLREAISYRMTFSQIIPILALFKPLSSIYYYTRLSSSIPNEVDEIVASSSAVLNSSATWNLAFVSIFLFSTRLWYPATFCSCCAVAVFMTSKPDIVTVTARRPILEQASECDDLCGQGIPSSSASPEQDDSYKIMNVFEIRHTFSDVGLIWPTKINKIPAGYRRIIWECSCGETLRADFENSNPRAVNDLEFKLRGIGYRSHTPHDQTGQGPSSSTNSGSPSLPPINPSAQQNVNQQAPTSSKRKMKATNADNHATKHGNLSNINSKKYFEVCVSVGRHTVNLGEINISSVTSDAQLFDEIWKTYHGIKGVDWKTRIRNWFLEPSDVLFVLFGVLRRHQVGIYKQPMEIPPQQEVSEGRYEYFECPMEVLPPMPGNIFLHYLEHARRKAVSKKEMPLYHTDSTFLNRLPKKLEYSIFGGETTSEPYMSFGWGIQIIERPSPFAQNLVAGLVGFTSAIICLTIFGIAWATLGHDAAIGIGQYTAGVLTLLDTAIYFSLQAYCNSLS